MRKTIVVRTNDRRLAARAVEAGFTRFLSDEALRGLGRIEVLRRHDGRILRGASHVGEWVELRSRDDEARVRALRGKRDLVVVETPNWKVIPLENLVAALGGSTELLAVATSPEEARLFLATLEKGVDGVVVAPRTAKDLARFASLLEPERPRHRLRPASITRILDAGVGERVCVDTTSLFGTDEGLLIGSSSRAFFLVAAETRENEFVAARPFRVNAGAVHSYLLSGESTQYLSELRSGARIEAVGRTGARRTVTVGRSKLETRPLLLIEARLGRAKAGVILQNAETVRLVTPRGAKSVGELRVGDQVLVHAESGARHFGMKIEERIREQ